MNNSWTSVRRFGSSLSIAIHALFFVGSFGIPKHHSPSQANNALLHTTVRSGPSSNCLYHRSHFCNTCLQGWRAANCRSILKYGNTGVTPPVEPDSDLITEAESLSPPGADDLRCAGFLSHLVANRACLADLSYAARAAEGLKLAAERDFQPRGGRFNGLHDGSVVWTPQFTGGSRRFILFSAPNPGSPTTPVTSGHLKNEWRKLIASFRRCDPRSIRVSNLGSRWKTRVRC